MQPKKISEIIVKNLIYIFPIWHSKLVKPFRDSLNGEMSLETYYCLETLKIRETATMTELAKQLKVPKQHVTKLVDQLSRHHFVERFPDEGDRRVTWIRLTPEAVAYLDEYHLKNPSFTQNLEERLSIQELEQLNLALDTLRELLPKLN